jgi:hypothetical protein
LQVCQPTAKRSPTVAARVTMMRVAIRADAMFYSHIRAWFYFTPSIEISYLS